MLIACSSERRSLAAVDQWHKDASTELFVLEPALVLSLLVGAFHTCVYIFVRGNLGWHIPGLLVGAILGALVGQAIGGSPEGGIFKSTDGGATWSPVMGDYPDLHRIILSRDRIWLIGDGGAINRIGLPANSVG